MMWPLALEAWGLAGLLHTPTVRSELPVRCFRR
jgi:hypothetical protein